MSTIKESLPEETGVSGIIINTIQFLSEVSEESTEEHIKERLWDFNVVHLFSPIALSGVIVPNHQFHYVKNLLFREDLVTKEDLKDLTDIQIFVWKDGTSNIFTKTTETSCLLAFSADVTKVLINELEAIFSENTPTKVH